MSITVKNLLKLPSLANAKVVAGKGGLDKIVSSVSVLEAAGFKELGEYAYPNDEFTGSEIVITGFLNNADDIESQYNSIKALANMGEAGLIIYYVGIYMKKIDTSLIKLADEMDFPLICMPVNQTGLRYSEAISDIMGVIVRDQLSGESMLIGLLEAISKRPQHQQNVATMVRLVSNRLKSSVVFTTESNHTLYEAAWPSELNGIHAQIESMSEQDFNINPAVFPGLEDALVYRQTIHASGTNYNLYIIHVGGALQQLLLQQAAEGMRIAVKLWGNESETNATSEIIDAILTDQPAKMKSLSSMLKVDIDSVDSMWVINGTGFTQNDVKNVIEEVEKFCTTVIADVYKEKLIIFTDNVGKRADLETLKSAIKDILKKKIIMSYFTNLKDTGEVRQAYLENDKYIEAAVIILPGRCFFGKGEIAFARKCRKIIDKGNDSVNEYLDLLVAIENRRGGEELIKTFSTFLLDTPCNVQRTSEIMFVHKNTIKYRMNQIDNILGFTAGDMPASEGLYYACGIKRLLE